MVANRAFSQIETFSFNEEFKDPSSGRLTLEGIQDAMPLLRILQDA